MRAHDQASNRMSQPQRPLHQAADKPSAGGLTRTPLSPQAALALQRTAGNDAVSKLIAAQQHACGDGCGHGPAVQRNDRAQGRGGQPKPHVAGVIQRSITMRPAEKPEGSDLLEEAKTAGGTTDAGGLFSFLVHKLREESRNGSGVPENEIAEFERNRETLEPQLFKWAAGTPGARGAKSHPQFGAKQQDRDYHTYTDLALALSGWMRAKPARHDEKELARNVKDNSDVELHLEILLTRVRAIVEDRRAEERSPTGPFRWEYIRQELETGTTLQPDAGGNRQFGHYQHYFDQVIQGKAEIPAEIRDQLRTRINGGMWKALEAPEQFSFRDKIVVLHDLMEYFGKHQRWNPPTAGNDVIADQHGQNLTTTAIDDHGNRVRADEDRGQESTVLPGGKVKNHPSTRRESAESTRLARRHDIPVWAGSSFTAMRMLNLAKSAGGTIEEISAVAWGIFAFWRLDYDHSFELAYHTLHEVMDIAQNFGVPYNALHRGKGLEEGHRAGITKQHVLDRLTVAERQLAEDHGRLTAGAQQVAEHLGKNPPVDRTPFDQLGSRLAALAQRIEQLRQRVLGVGRAVSGIAEHASPADRQHLRQVMLDMPGLATDLSAIAREINDLDRDLVDHLSTYMST
ncbi:hypothetical protein ACWEV3_04010 [Saccharopolyspora sp. NPDC003752]